MENLRLNQQQQHRASKSRKTILKVAGSLFGSQGFKATTLRQISRKTGANGALVSYYFGNKEGLRDAVIKEKLEKMQDLIQPLEGSGAEALSAAVRAIFQHIREDENFHRIALRALLEDPVFKTKLRSQIWEPLFDSLTGLIERSGIERREAQNRCLVVFGMIQQYASLRCFFRDALPGGVDNDAGLARFEDYVASTLVAELCRA
jgi:AcrR family transcriptional regulator